MLKQLKSEFEEENIRQIEGHIAKVETYYPKSKLVQTRNGFYRLNFSDKDMRTPFYMLGAYTNHLKHEIKIAKSSWSVPPEDIPYTLYVVFHEIGHAQLLKSSVFVDTVKRNLAIPPFIIFNPYFIKEEKLADKYAIEKLKALPILRSDTEATLVRFRRFDLLNALESNNF